MSSHTPTDMRTSLVVTTEAEIYAAAVPGADVQAARTGPGVGPNVSRATTFDHVTVASCAIGFPILGAATVAENTALIILITSAPPGSRWSGIDLEPGTMMLYGPGALHTGISPAGLNFTFAAINTPAMQEAADRLELKLNLPDRGRVRTFDPSSDVRPMMELLNLAGDSTDYTEMQRLSTLHSAVAALSTEHPSHDLGIGAKIDSRLLVHVCINYAETVERTPSITEMCLVAHVSERRLRDAFTEVFGVPPLRYFRYKSLTTARNRLTRCGAGDGTVSEIASDLGFNNFGRFAREYQSAYGELPSLTLAKHG